MAYMWRVLWWLSGGMTAVSLAGCIELFEPVVPGSSRDFLVVDGFINIQGRTRIRLSHTSDINSTTANAAEAKAALYIEEEMGVQYAMRDAGNGNYVSDSLLLNPAKRYRLRIKTALQREYTSAFVDARVTPPIDAVTWKNRPLGIQVYVSAHDNDSRTHYYRWEYIETWEYISPWNSLYEYSPPGPLPPGNYILPLGVITVRTKPINRCWATEYSNDIQLGSSVRLAQDVIADYPLRLLPASSANKLQEKYSVLVRQYGQTAEEYAYWEKLKKNTEVLGTLFDPQPSQLTGNIQNIVEPGEVVIGYIGAHSVAEKRLFISRAELPADFSNFTGYEQCVKQDSVTNPGLLPYYLYPGTQMLIDVVEVNQTKNYLIAKTECVDCQKRGGVTQKPAFWR
ncbi:DUF4249 domain-containing protein [Hymenobacter swuensis]|nr:DUF4249 domain-containing protein [Hymenobacter swuensis]